MRIREARTRDAQAIAQMMPQDTAIAVDTLISMIQENASPMYVAVDFSANILGCALDKEKVYLSENCLEPGVDDALREKYGTCQ